jgi:hypothetical protein
VHPAALRPIGFVEIAVGVEDLINMASDDLDELRVMFGRFTDQAGLHLGAILRRHARGQPIHGLTDDLQVILAQRARGQRVRDDRQLRR